MTIDNTNTQTRPWTDVSGAMLSDQLIRQVSKKWTAEIWEQFLVETVERSSSYQREVMLRPTKYDTRTEALSESIWENVGLPENDETSKIVRRACRDKLTPRQQQIIRGIFWQGLSERELGNLTGVTRSTVQVQKKRALEKLKRHLSEVLPDYADDRKSSNPSEGEDLHRGRSSFRTAYEGLDRNKPFENLNHSQEIKNVYPHGNRKFESMQRQGGPTCGLSRKN